MGRKFIKTETVDLNGHIENEWPDLQYRKNKFTNLVKRLIIDENGNEVEYSPRLPTTKLSELPGKMFDSSKTEYLKDWLNSYNIT